MSLPNTYLQLEYIESSGTQWIDTGYIPNQDTKVSINFQRVEGTGAFFGSRTGSNISTSSCYDLFFTSDDTFRSDYYRTIISKSSLDTVRHTILKDKNDTYFDGTLLGTAPISTFDTIYNSTIFAINTAGTIEKYSKLKLYNCTIYDNDTLVRDYIPAMRLSDNVVGLYDLANDVFYTNMGTGTFTYGHELKENIILEDNPIDVVLTDADLELTANFKKIGGKKYIIGE